MRVSTSPEKEKSSPRVDHEEAIEPEKPGGMDHLMKKFPVSRNHTSFALYPRKKLATRRRKAKKYESVRVMKM